MLYWCNCAVANENFKELDRKTKKLFRLFWDLYPHSDVDQLYLPRKMGGRGLRYIEDVVCEEKCSLSCYVQKSNDKLIVEVVCCVNHSLLRNTRQTNKMSVWNNS